MLLPKWFLFKAHFYEGKHFSTDDEDDFSAYANIYFQITQISHPRAQILKWPKWVRKDPNEQFGHNFITSFISTKSILVTLGSLNIITRSQ